MAFLGPCAVTGAMCTIAGSLEACTRLRINTLRVICTLYTTWGWSGASLGLENFTWKRLGASLGVGYVTICPSDSKRNQ